MQLPFMTRSQSGQLAERLNDRADFEANEFLEWRNVQVDEIDLESIRDRTHSLMQEQRNAIEIELIISGDIFLALRLLPTSIRENYDFWRGITLAFFHDLAIYRTENSSRANSNTSQRKWEIFGAGSNPREILAWRMFTRGAVSAVQNSDGTYEFPNMLETGNKSHDFWMSHLLGTRTSAEHTLARGFIKLQSHERMPTGMLRPFVRDGLNRPKRTMAMHLMTDHEVDVYLKKEKSRVEMQIDDSGDE